MIFVILFLYFYLFSNGIFSNNNIIYEIHRNIHKTTIFFLFVFFSVNKKYRVLFASVHNDKNNDIATTTIGYEKKTENLHTISINFPNTTSEN